MYNAPLCFISLCSFAWKNSCHVRQGNSHKKLANRVTGIFFWLVGLGVKIRQGLKNLGAWDHVIAYIIFGGQQKINSIKTQNEWHHSKENLKLNKKDLCLVQFLPWPSIPEVNKNFLRKSPGAGQILWGECPGPGTANASFVLLQSKTVQIWNIPVVVKYPGARKILLSNARGAGIFSVQMPGGGQGRNWTRH